MCIYQKPRKTISGRVKIDIWVKAKNRPHFFCNILKIMLCFFVLFSSCFAAGPQPQKTFCSSIKEVESFSHLFYFWHRNYLICLQTKRSISCRDIYKWLWQMTKIVPAIDGSNYRLRCETSYRIAKKLFIQNENSNFV